MNRRNYCGNFLLLLTALTFAVMTNVNAGDPECCKCKCSWDKDDDSAEEGSTGFSYYSGGTYEVQTKGGSVSGSNGSYSLSCYAKISLFSPLEYYPATFGHTSNGEKKGYKKQTLAWKNPENQHGAPSNSIWSYDATSDVSLGATWNANNWELETGSCYAYGYAKAEISGIASDSCELSVGGNVEEGYSQVGVTAGPVGFSGPINVSSDIASLSKTGDASVNGQANPATVGQNLKIRGRVLGRSTITASAKEASVSASTSIVTYEFDKDSGGTHSSCPEGADHEH